MTPQFRNQQLQKPRKKRKKEKETKEVYQISRQVNMLSKSKTTMGS